MAKGKKSFRKLQRRLNQTTFLLVLGMGLIATMTIVSDPVGVQSRAQADREPASVSDSQFQANADSVKAASVLTIECAKRDDIVSLTQQIRLKGRVCQEDDKISIITTQIENTRNGYVATVFHQDREFSTDFIQLSEGENQLLVKHTLSDGNIEERKVTVTRR